MVLQGSLTEFMKIQVKVFTVKNPWLANTTLTVQRLALHK